MEQAFVAPAEVITTKIYLGHNDVAVQTSVESLRVSLHAHLKGKNKQTKVYVSRINVTHKRAR